ncbi:hypothetical protein [Kribbella catacumbae]|uniref:hypothetical protein n=1 Tax=Kribbella catacumbae TaxID=460086 RepID=UPI000368C7C4|nr:hypothetical protein [Kribbella catacumbae]
MTRRVTLPATAEVRTALDRLRESESSTGRRPNTVALARSLGLANTTFRRNFPTIVEELSAPRPRTAIVDEVGEPPAGSLRDVNRRLRAENRQLREQQELACAQIQRLTIDCQQLREQLEQVTNVGQIRPMTPSRQPR